MAKKPRADYSQRLVSKEGWGREELQDGPGLWLAVSRHLSASGAQHFGWAEDKGILWRPDVAESTGLVTTSAGVLRDKKGGSHWRSPQHCSCRNPKAKQQEAGWVNTGGAWK